MPATKANHTKILPKIYSSASLMLMHQHDELGMHAKGIALFHVINETTRRSFGDHHDDIYEQIMNTETKKRLIRKSTLNIVP